MMPTPILLGEWISGDTLKDFDYSCLKSDGTAFDLTGYSVRLVGRSRDNRANAIDIAGALTATPTDGIARFASLGTGLPLTAGKRSERYELRVKATRTSDSKFTFSEAFVLMISRLPV